VRLISDAKVEWSDDASRVRGVRVGWLEGQIVVAWPEVGVVFARPSGGGMRFVANEGTDGETLRKFRATELLACERYLAGSVSLHASAVHVASGAIALVGDSGSGKSTMAMALVESAGASFVADDVVPVDWAGGTAHAAPVDDSYWLLDDARRWFGDSTDAPGKLACAPRARASVATPLLGIVDLAFGFDSRAVTVERLRGHEAFVVWSRAHVCFRCGLPGEDTRNLDARARLHAAVPVFRLQRPRSLATLAEGTQAVRRLAEDLTQANLVS